MEEETKEALKHLIKIEADIQKIKHDMQELEVKMGLEQIKQELKEKEQIKKQLTANIGSVMNERRIDCIKINEDEQVKCSSKKKPLTKKTLTRALHSFFKGDVEMADKLLYYILGEQEESVTVKLEKCKQK